MLRRDFSRMIPAAVGATRLLRASTSWPRYKSTLPLDDLRIPAEHPYMVVTRDRIARAKKRAADSPQAKQMLDRLLASADDFTKTPLGALPPKGDRQHSAIGGRLFTAAQAHALSGERRYAEWARDGLLAYAAIYPGLPFTNGSMKLFTVQSLDEAMWMVSIAQAYDLVAASGVFTPEQARRVEEDLLRASTACFKIEDFEHDPRIRNMHFRCYNFQAWHVGAVGLAGLAIRDRDLVDWAINSPYGLRHLVAHDIRDDGMFWERSQSYHNFVLDALTQFTEGLAHCGVDVYNMSVPADRADDDINYSTGSTGRPMSLRMMFEAQFYMTFPDLSYATLGDSNPGPLRPGWPYLAAFERYHDPKLAWLIRRSLATSGEASARRPDWRPMLFDPPAGAPAAFPLREGRFANSGQYSNGCSLFPATGLAVLRQASGDYTTQPDSTAVALCFGPYGGGHNHPDQLNLVLYAQGRQWLPDFASMPYETHWKNEWTAQTVSHNTVVVDGVSQKPTVRRNTEWPSDRGTDRVFGVLERFEARSKSASATCDRAYEGIRLRRAVRLEGPWVVDDFTASDAKGAEHQYDLVLHIDGQFEEGACALEPRSGKLGDICGYQLVEQRQGGTATGAFHLTFASEGKKLRLWVPGEGATEVIVAEGLTNSPERKMAMLVLRRKAAAARFITVFEPVDAGDAIRAVRTTKAALLIESAKGTRRAPLD